MNVAPSMPFAFLLVLAFLLGCTPTSTPPPPGTTVVPAATETAAATPTRVDAPDLRGEQITLHLFCDISGYLAAFNEVKVLAAQDMVAAINKGGGLFGAEVGLEVVDTAGSADVAIAAFERTQRLEPVIFLLLLCDAPSEIALAPLLHEASIPALGPGLAPATYYTAEGGSLFAYNVRPEQQFAVMAQYLRTNWAEIKPLGTDDEIRMALFHWPEESAGSSLDPDIAAALANELGLQIALVTEVERAAEPNVFDAIYRARDANVNAIYVTAQGPVPAEILNATSALGLDQRVIVAGPSFAFGHSMLPYLFGVAHTSDAYFTTSTAWWTEADNPAIGQAVEIFNAAGHSAEIRDGGYLSMLGAVDIARRALEEAILAEGFEDLDAATLMQALAGLEDYAVMGGLYEVDYTREPRALDTLRVMAFGAEVESISVIQDSQPVPSTGD